MYILFRYLDIAGFQSKYHEIDDTCIHNFDLIFNNIKLNKKVLFGTDWPLFNFMQPISKQVDFLKEISGILCGTDNQKLNNLLFNNSHNIMP